jgi:hypothetical protein
VARALGRLPKIDTLFGRADLSYSKVRALIRVATPESEQDFIDVAMHATASQLERLTRAYHRVRDNADATERPLSQRRFVRRAETPGGMIRIEMQMTPEEAAMVWNAVMSALDGSEASAEASAESHDPCGDRSSAVAARRWVPGARVRA